ncbi:flp pilus-assembly TadE/G-like family protein [Paenarthrobacter sp. CM16]|uniref:Rv3654c family TadE-like protein n=1 Tax=Paenarthrobacter sp. CM16 TaxID=2738447 RepID=UPI001551DAED|nr:Rv3654c family TadE-like protein [Paenarthrobacter sp. CM16]NQD88128.1 flp pilus-assembly TadE/G-like family protein [Paenarthrobacter sp. CM16]
MNPLPAPVHSERGAGTVLALTLGAVVMALLVGVLVLAQAGVLASRAASAADLGALAAADAARGLTSGEPCAVASGVVAQHGATMTSCTVTGGMVVDVATELDHPFDWGAATGRARAGPPP